MPEVEERPLDRIDRRILDTLQADGRISNVALARQVGLVRAEVLMETVARLKG